MSGSFVNVYSQMFEDMFMLNFQASGRLRGTTRELHGLVGDAFKMKYGASVSMDQHGAYNADIPIKNQTVSAPTITFEDYELKLAIDQFEQLNFNADALNLYARSHAKAIGRRVDQFIIDAVVAGATKSVAVGTTNLTFAKLREARALLGQDEVDGVLHIAAHWNNIESLLNETKVTSTDFVTQKVINGGTMDGQTYLGFIFHQLGDRADEGGLPKSGDDRTVIAWSEDAITLGFRMDPKVTMTDVPENLRVETLSSMSAGAKVGDANGVVSIICDETA